jgi:hypothetical protein
MSAPTLRVTVISFGGDAQILEVSAHDTARSLLAHGTIAVPDDARAIFLVNGSVLQPDFSFASQGICTGTVIHLVLQRRSVIQRRRPSKTSSEELLRLADVSFRRFEMARSQRRMALRVRSLAQQPAIGQRMATKIVAALDISEDPLPSAWREVVEDSDIEHPSGL